MFEDSEDMISACDTQEFVPFGRAYCAIHPGKTCFQVKGADSADHGIPLLKALRDISISKDGKKESWRLRSCAESAHGSEEELYIHENTVVWSRKTSDGAQAVIKSFTVDSPVQEALWYSFLLPADEVQTSPNEAPLIHKQLGVCIIEARNVSVFTSDGKDYVTPVPFQIKKTWPIMNGLFFERACIEKSTNLVTRTPKKEEKQQNLPVLFSMLHPLDDIAPVICRTGAANSSSILGNSSTSKVSFVTETSQQIVFTSEEPSLVMTYDRLLSAHSIWTVRMTRKEEVLQMRGHQASEMNLCMSTSCFPSDVGNVTPAVSKASSSLLSRLNTTQSPSFSPFRSYHSKPGSPLVTHSKHNSPSVSHLATLSRTESPSTSASNLHHRFHTPTSAIKHSPAVFARTPVSHNTSLTDTYMYPSQQDAAAAPLDPEVCVDHIWTESGVARDGPSGCASKVFLTSDLCGQRFICYFISSRQHLRCVKFEESNDKSQLIFGSMSTITCRDACSLSSLNMILLLDNSSNLVLYSGLTKVSMVHMAEIPAPLQLSSSTTPHQPHPPVSMVLRPASPLRFISGPITSSRPPSALDVRFDDEVQMLSPVPTEFNDSSQLMENSLTEELSFQQVTASSSPATLIASLKHAVNARFCVELNDGSLYRAALPQMSRTPIIELCLEGLRQILPRDSSLQVLTRWYAASNSPGSMNGQSEWTQFCRCVLSLMGYDVDKLPLTKQTNATESPVSAKKARPSDQGSDGDWEYLLQSHHQNLFTDTQQRTTGFAAFPQSGCTKPPEQMSLDTGAALFLHIPAVLLALHLVYEELKLHSVVNEELCGLAELLYQLSCDLHCELYTDHYSRDWPTLYSKAHHRSCIPEEYLQQMQQPSFFTRIPPMIYEWLLSYLRGVQLQPFPYLAGVSEHTKYIIAMFVVMFESKDTSSITWSEYLRKVARAGHRSPDFEESLVAILKRIPPDSNQYERLVLFISHLESFSDTLVEGVSLLLKEALFQCRERPPADWSQAAYTLIGREDLGRQYGAEEETGGMSTQDREGGVQCVKGVKEEEDGMEYLHHQLLKLQFSDDLRIHEVRKLLQSSKPVKVVVTQRPEVSDHEFIEEQERHLYATCIRTMALPVGRGLFTLSTYQPLPTETLPIPKLCLTGRASPRNTAVDLSHIDTPANMNHWPLFHNGVAASLRIDKHAKLNSTWILFNKCKITEMSENEHAGFLMGLGLNGHLGYLANYNIHDYLTRIHEMISVGLILGVAAGKRGTMDVITTKALSLHLRALLPPTSTELDIAHNVQVAAILGLGLVYQGTAHRHTAEVLLSEIGRPPGPELENCTDRESYSLASGLALGMVMFGKGTEMSSLSDLCMADELYHYMVGGHKRPLTGASKERYKSPSYQIMEGDSVNIDVTSPGATLALGMVFFNSGNSAVAGWLTAPDTQFLLDFVRPDFLMLRMISKGLIMWQDVVPTEEWITSNLPEIVTKYAFNKLKYKEDPDCDVDFESMSQAYCNIVAGACMALGLKFAGSANQEAFVVLYDMVRKILMLMGKPLLVEQAGKSTVENTLVVIVLALAMVMSGTGNLEVLRLCRLLRSRVGHSYNHVLYGSHMAISMAVGLLFLGSCRYTLCTKPEAIAAMLCAFFPKFPIHSNDNRYHLQALRHLFVLASEPRVIIPKDVDSGQPCYAPLELSIKTGDSCSTAEVMAPCILPELDTIQEVKVKGQRYWPINFKLDKSCDHLREILIKNGHLYVKKRAGHLSYASDPKGYHSLLSQSLTHEAPLGKLIKTDDIESFSSDPRVLSFAEYFCNSSHKQEFDLTQFLSKVLYECVSQEKLEVLSLYVSLQQLVDILPQRPCTQRLQQVKLITAFYERLRRGEGGSKEDSHMISAEFLLHLQSSVTKLVHQWMDSQNSQECLMQYFSQQEIKNSEDYGSLATYLCWFEVLHPMELLELGITETTPFPVLHQTLRKKGLPVSCSMGLVRALQMLVKR